jgi:hypothetical protein
MSEISSLNLTAELLPKPEARAWKSISEFALTVPLDEIQSANVRSLHDDSQNIEQFTVSQLRASLYFTQRIINNQQGSPNSQEMESVIRAISLIHLKLKQGQVQ